MADRSSLDRVTWVPHGVRGRDRPPYLNGVCALQTALRRCTQTEKTEKTEKTRFSVESSIIGALCKPMGGKA